MEMSQCVTNTPVKWFKRGTNSAQRQILRGTIIHKTKNRVLLAVKDPMGGEELLRYVSPEDIEIDERRTCE